MKFLILSTDILNPSWKSLDKKLAEIKKALKIWDVSMTTVLLTPVVKDGKVDSAWLSSIITPYFDKGYDVVALHMSDKQRKEWGIEPSLRGVNPNSGKEYGDFYFWADEKTLREGLNQFVQTCLHEFCHEYYQQTGLRDDTHWYHFHNPDITGLVESFDWTLYQPRRMNLKKQVTLLERVKELLIKLVGMQKVSQKKTLQPLIERKANNIVEEMARLGHKVRIVQGYRSIEEQNKFYAQGRTTPGAVITNAKGGESFHNYGVAVDFVFRKEGYNATESLWHLLGKVGKAQGFEWGGDWTGFVDRPHFEMKLGYSLSDFQSGKVDYSKFN